MVSGCGEGVVNIMLRSDDMPDVMIMAEAWETCTLERLDQHIRTLQAARKWLVEEQRRKQTENK